MFRPLHSRSLLPVLLSVVPLSAQRANEFKPTMAPDPVKGMHDMSPLTAAERALLRPQPRTLAAGSVAERIRAEGPMTASGPVLFAEPGDGRSWVLASTYKASFGADGFTYIPFFGSDAPKNYPVQFVLRSLRVGGREVPLDPARAVREDARVILDRGAVRELYDLAPRQVEQTFVVDVNLPGDVELELDVVTELREDAERPGLQFGNALGNVDYGTAYLVTGAVKTEIACAFTGPTIRLRVADAQRGSGPVVIDPIISTSATSWALTHAAANPDIAYDVTTDRYMVVQESVFSAADSDIVTELRDGNGAFVPGSQLVYDATPAPHRFPRVANLNAADRFLVVTEHFNEHAAPGQQYTIWGATAGAASPFSMGQLFQVSEPLSQGDKYVADVGGDPSPSGTTYWTVVYTRAFTATTDWDIHARQVDASGTPRPNTILIENSGSTIFASPQISLSNANGSATAARWMVVYSFRFSATDWDVYGASLDHNGGIARVSGPIDSGFVSDLYPQVSSPSLDWTNDNPVFMVSYERQSPLHMMGTVVSAQLVRIVPPTDLSTTFGFGGFWCRTESDGCRFAVTHGLLSAGNNVINVATLGVDDTTSPVRFVLHDASQPLAQTSPPFNPISAAAPMIASKRSGGGTPTDYCVAFLNRDVAPDRLNVTTYEGRRLGTMFTTQPTGCGGLTLTVSGRPYMGETVRFALGNLGTDQFGELLGIPGPAVPLCGAICSYGLDLDVPPIHFPGLSLLTLELPGTFNLAGARLAVQGYSIGSGSCLGTFRFSDTIEFTIR